MSHDESSLFYIAEMVTVDLQWFVLYCDKNRPAKDTCDEFYEPTTTTSDNMGKPTLNLRKLRELFQLMQPLQ